MKSVAVLSILAMMCSTWSTDAFPLYSDTSLAAQEGKLLPFLLCLFTFVNGILCLCGIV